MIHNLSGKSSWAGILLLSLVGLLLLIAGKNNPVNPPAIRDTCPQRLPYFLPDEVHETSGLAWYNGLLWTINDSGNDPLVFGIEPSTGKIVCTVKMMHATNIDWEEIAVDTAWMYVADFGNNAGTRRDLCMYRFPLKWLNSDSIQHIEAERINFYYEDQHDFSPQLWHSAWDAEALIPAGDSILILTKDWEHQFSAVYTFPNKLGNHAAHRKFNLKVKGLVTGSSLDSSRTWLAICGYDNYQPFLSVIKADSLNFYANIQLPVLRCDSLYGLQTEGVCFDNEKHLFLSSEASVIPQCLFRYSFR